MELNECLARLKLFYNSFLNFTKGNSSTPEAFEQIVSIIKDNNFGENSDELRSILHIIYKIASQHKRNPVFMDKIQKILLLFEAKIKQSFSNLEILRIFQNDKFLLLFLINQKMVTIDEDVATFLIQKLGGYYSNFFYPEIEPFLESIRNKTFICLFDCPQISDENFEKKRQEGENDSDLCRSIRKDSLDEFISIYNDQSLGPISTVPRSVFETNILLAKNAVTILEYAAFFGSISIVDFLLKTGKKPPKTLWIYAIHSGSIEMIHFLEENGNKPEKCFYEKYFLTAIKCHCNDIAHHIFDTYFEDKNKKFYEQCFAYYNFEFLPDDFTDNYESIFEYACHYDYVKIVKILMNENKINLNLAIFKILEIFIKFQKKIFFNEV